MCCQDQILVHRLFSVVFAVQGVGLRRIYRLGCRVDVCSQHGPFGTNYHIHQNATLIFRSRLDR